MKEKLVSLGWTCSKCSCSGSSGVDCAHANHRGVVIQIRDTRFKIIKRSSVVESGWNYELDAKLKANDLL